MTLPVPSEMTAVVGNYITAAEWNSNVRDAVNFLANPPLFIGYQTVSQSIPNSAFTSITFDSETVDTYNGHSTTSNTSRYTAQVAGWYEVTARCGTSGSSAGKRIINIAVNGSGVWVNEIDPPNTDLLTNTITATVYMNANDYVETQFYQTSGAALSTTVSSLYYPSMSVRWVHA